MSRIFHDGARPGAGLFAAALVSSALCTALFAAALPAAQAASTITLSETGSTLLYPLFQLWIPDYGRVAPDVTITSAAPVRAKESKPRFRVRRGWARRMRTCP
jgi:ABC-type phosphate transport system substrate-binding protein